MKNRFLTIAGLALAVGALAPATAKADCANGTGSVTPGFGGFFTGCWAGFDISRVYENAGNVNDIFYFNGMPARNFVAENSPNPSPPVSSFLFNNDCGASGLNSTAGSLCSPLSRSIVWGTNTELVFGLRNPSLNWIYTGTDANRNSPPSPGGIQNYLWQVTNGGVSTGSYLLGWEDLNSGCAFSSTTSLTVDQSALSSTTALNDLFATCNNPNAFGFDNDYNDFYMLITPRTLGTPSQVVPEPMTMSLLATGLIGLGGASARRRKKQ